MDVFSLNGRHVASFDIKKLISEKVSREIQLTQLDFVLIPVLKWTGRRNKILQSFGRTHHMFDSPKVVLVGRVLIQRTLRKCIMVVNLERLTIDKFKVLSFIDTQEINCVSYGPFDNGHILLGLSDGWLLAYEYPSLERIESK